MRLGSLILLTALSAPCATLAEEAAPAPSEIPSAALPVATAPAAPAPSALEVQLQKQTAEQEAQLLAERNENQRLRQQLKQAQADSAPPPLITEQQTWYAIGAGSALLGVIIGALLRGGRRTRREWLN
ncbi:translation initiation factor 2 [Ectopseudomonas mendocina]|uniref:Translation initiation factor 2 n=1 Tax=Ectopseudomonas mendocina TaxID=300 RepID=A0ABZ2RM57_ECTME